jgi:RNA polymerase sigma-70 factor (ECF subfamily)
MPQPDPADRPRTAPAGGTSATLLQRLRANDQVAWASLVFLYGPLVRYWAGRRGVFRADADDVCQEVFRAVAAGLAGFRRDRPGDSFRGWLGGIARNILLRLAEKAGRQPRAAGGSEALLRLQEVADAAGDPADGNDPPEELGGLYRRGLELVRGEFEPRTWRAFWEHVVDGRAVADVAAGLGVTPGAVRQAKYRVLRRLREELGDLVEGAGHQSW